MIPRESDFNPKQESSTSDSAKIPKATSNPTSSWSRLKDPRVVRVSRALGGKDRHSKVCTVRGLRDRRVRLSVPTAIQLYDLQDRLGLNQPSKVVDWLLNAAKHEIDELPPLQIPQGSFTHNFQPLLNSDELRDKQGLKINDSINWTEPLKESRLDSTIWGKPKEFSGETSDREENWTRNEEEKQFSLQENQGAYLSANNFLSRQNPASLLTSSMPYNSFMRWDPSNLTLSHPPRSHELSMGQPEDLHNFSLVPMQSALSVPSASHQVLVYQHGTSTHSYFPFQMATSDSEMDQKQVHFQSSAMSNSPLTSPVDSTTQPVRQFHFSMTENLLPSQNNGARERGKQRQ